jgi:hypothetical protein
MGKINARSIYKLALIMWVLVTLLANFSYGSVYSYIDEHLVSLDDHKKFLAETDYFLEDEREKNASSDWFDFSKTFVPNSALQVGDGHYIKITTPKNYSKQKDNYVIHEVSGLWANSAGRSYIDDADKHTFNPRFYFKVNKEGWVDIKLMNQRRLQQKNDSKENDGIDTYLYLLDKDGKKIAANDDIAELKFSNDFFTDSEQLYSDLYKHNKPSRRESGINKKLAAGVYTLVAATYGDGSNGQFALSIGGDKKTISDLSTEPLKRIIKRKGRWSKSGGADWSNDWSRPGGELDNIGNRFYTFKLNQEEEVTIDLTSEFFINDTVLYLLDADGEKVNIDDDSGGNFQARIKAKLSKGNYKIIATTFLSNKKGNFTLSITAFFVEKLEEVRRKGEIFRCIGIISHKNEECFDLKRVEEVDGSIKIRPLTILYSKAEYDLDLSLLNDEKVIIASSEDTSIADFNSDYTKLIIKGVGDTRLKVFTTNGREEEFKLSVKKGRVKVSFANKSQDTATFDADTRHVGKKIRKTDVVIDTEKYKLGDEDFHKIPSVKLQYYSTDQKVAKIINSASLAGPELKLVAVGDTQIKASVSKSDPYFSEDSKGDEYDLAINKGEYDQPKLNEFYGGVEGVTYEKKNKIVYTHREGENNKRLARSLIDDLTRRDKVEQRYKFSSKDKSVVTFLDEKLIIHKVGSTEVEVYRLGDEKYKRSKSLDFTITIKIKKAKPKWKSLTFYDSSVKEEPSKQLLNDFDKTHPFPSIKLEKEYSGSFKKKSMRLNAEFSGNESPIYKKKGKVKIDDKGYIDIDFEGVGEAIFTIWSGKEEDDSQLNVSVHLKIKKSKDKIVFSEKNESNTADKFEKTYGDSEFQILAKYPKLGEAQQPKFSYKITSGKGFATVSSDTGRVTIKGVGTVKIKAEVSDAKMKANFENLHNTYTLNIKKSKNIVFSEKNESKTADKFEKTYGDSEFKILAKYPKLGEAQQPKFSYKIISGKEFATVSSDTGLVTIKGVGTVKIKAEVSESDAKIKANFENLHNTYTLNINQSKKNIVFSEKNESKTADKFEKTYGDSEFRILAKYPKLGEAQQPTFSYKIISGKEFATVSSDTGLVTIKGVGTVKIKAEVSESDAKIKANFENLHNTYTLNINQSKKNIVFSEKNESKTADKFEKTYGDSEFKILAKYPKLGEAQQPTFSYKIISGKEFATVSSDTGLVTIKGVGTVKIKAEVSESDAKIKANFENLHNTYTLNINQSKDNIVFSEKNESNIADKFEKTYGDSEFRILAKYPKHEEAQQPTFSYKIISGKEFASVSSDTGWVTIKGVGTVKIKAEVSESDAKGKNNFENPDNFYTLKINQSKDNIVFSEKNESNIADKFEKTYGDSKFRILAKYPKHEEAQQPTFSYKIISGKEFASVSSDTGWVTIKGVGTVKIKAEVSESDAKGKNNFENPDNIYTLKINQSKDNIVFSEKNESKTADEFIKTYGDSEFQILAKYPNLGEAQQPKFSYTIISGKEFATVSSNTGWVTIKGVGTVRVLAEVPGDQKSKFLSATDIYDLKIKKASKPIELKLGGPHIKINQLDKEYPLIDFIKEDKTQGFEYEYFTYNDADLKVDSQGYLTVKRNGFFSLKILRKASKNYFKADASYWISAVRKKPELRVENMSAVYSPGGLLNPKPEVDGSPHSDAITYEVISGKEFVALDGNGQLKIKGVGTATVKATLPGDQNYNNANFTFKVTIAKADQAPIHVDDIKLYRYPKSHDFTVNNIKVTGGSVEGPVTFASDSPIFASTKDGLHLNNLSYPYWDVDGDLKEDWWKHHYGIGIVKATKEGNSNYKDVSKTFKVTILKPDHEKTFMVDNNTSGAKIEALNNKICGDEFTLNVKRLGQTVPGYTDYPSTKLSYSSLDESIAKVDENSGKVSLVGIGTTEIIATLAETRVYAETEIASYTINVTEQGNQAIQFKGEKTVYIYGDDQQPPVKEISQGWGSGSISYGINDNTDINNTDITEINDLESGFTVDANTGLVTFDHDSDTYRNVIEVDIGAFKEGDNCYKEAEDHYSIIWQKKCYSFPS